MNAQREDILDRFTVAVAQHGYDEAAIERVLARAGISPALLLRHFQSPEDCFLVVCERALADFAPTLAHSYGAEDRWQDALSAALAGLLELLDVDLPLAVLLVVRAPDAGARVKARRAQVLVELAAVLDRGALESPARIACPDRPVADALVAEMFALIHERLLNTHRRPRLIELHPLLTSIALAPYLGPEAAARALAQPPGVPRPRDQRHAVPSG